MSIELQAFDQSGNRRQAIWGIEREEDTKVCSVSGSVIIVTIFA